MKPVAVTALLTLTISQAMAGDYFCRPVFEKKLRKIQNTQTDGGIAEGAVVVGSIATVLTPAAVVTLPATLAYTAGFFAADSWIMTPKEYRIHSVHSLITESAYTRDENLVNQESAFNRLADSLKEDPDSVVSEDLGEQSLLIPYYKNLKNDPTQTFDRTQAKTMTDYVVEEINQNRQKNKVSFDQVAAVVKELSKTDAFCPNSTAMSLKKIKQLVRSKL